MRGQIYLNPNMMILPFLHTAPCGEGASFLATGYLSPTRFFKRRRLKAPTVTSGCLQQLAPLPTTTPESAGLCAWRAIGNLIRVTDFQ